MKITLALLLLIGFSSFAQDTLIWKNKSRTVVTITDLYEDTLFYTKVSDTMLYNCPLSKLNSIIYKDGSKRDFEGLYIDSVPDALSLEVPVIFPPGRDTALYNKGVRDAKKHYTLKSYWFERRKLNLYDENHYWKQYMELTELEIEFPDKELEIKSEYRAGYVDQCRLLRIKHQRKTAVIIVVTFTLIAATLIL